MNSNSRKSPKFFFGYLFYLTALAGCGGGNDVGQLNGVPGTSNATPLAAVTNQANPTSTPTANSSAVPPTSASSTANGTSQCGDSSSCPVTVTGSPAAASTQVASGSSSSNLPNANGSANGVFAEPSGPLCAVVTSNICAEPTASTGLTAAQLTAITRDPKGSLFQLRRFGSSFTDHYHEIYNRDGITVPDDDYYLDAYKRFESTEKTIVFGKNAIQVDGLTFNFQPNTIDNKNQTFVNAAASKLVKLIPESEIFPLSVAIAWVKQDLPDYPFSQGAISTYDSVNSLFFADLITDRTVVNDPPDHLIHYEGEAAFMGGTGAPLAGSQNLNEVNFSCPITFTLDTQNGRISPISQSCTDEDGSTGTISFDTLWLKGSRITSMLQDEASASATGPSRTYITMKPHPMTSAMMRSTKIGGQVTGQGATFMEIYASGPSGAIIVWAKRK